MDTVGEFLTRIRNAAMAKHENVDLPASKLRAGVAKALKDSGYISDFKVVKDGKQGMMRVILNYYESGEPRFKSLRRVSRPGLRVYVAKDKIPHVRSGYGMSILSTSKGVLSSKEAQVKGVGGELLCTVW